MILKKIFAEPGMRVRIPQENYRLLPEEGATVQWSMHWAKALERKEIRAEDVEVEPAEARDGTKTKAKAKNPMGESAAKVEAAGKTPGVAVS